MEPKIKIRLSWVKLYQESGNAGKVCSHYGISRFTLRKWYKRYELLGVEGLHSLSRKPHTSPYQKLNYISEQQILVLRKERKLGARRIQNELKRLHGISFSTATIHKVLQKHNLGRLNLKRHYRKQVKRYSAKVPGVRIQIDVCKIASNLYQYTAIDDCTRYKILALYKRRTAINTVSFLEQVLERMPFPVQRIQTDRGQEFFAYIVQDYLKEHKIKFCLIKPLSPHLNGKVERSQKTDLDAFYSSVDIRSIELPKQLHNWEYYYNHNRGHTSLAGKTPWEKYQDLESSVPSIQEIEKNYDPLKEPLIMQNYKYNKELRNIIKLKKELSMIN